VRGGYGEVCNPAGLLSRKAQVSERREKGITSDTVTLLKSNLTTNLYTALTTSRNLNLST